MSFSGSVKKNVKEIYLKKYINKTRGIKICIKRKKKEEKRERYNNYSDILFGFFRFGVFLGRITLLY